VISINFINSDDDVHEFDKKKKPIISLEEESALKYYNEAERLRNFLLQHYRVNKLQRDSSSSSSSS
jgi:hypothetical protein